MEENIPLGPLTTLQVGGPARFLVRVTSEAELVEAVKFARERELPVLVLGGGSNLLVGDAGFDGVVIQIGIVAALEFVERGEYVECRAAAGVDWDAFTLAVCERGLSGVESLAGIPGLVGGTPVQNVGAYGQEVAETIRAVRALDMLSLQFVELSAGECGFGYRTSILNGAARGRYIVTEVLFRFDPKQNVMLRYEELKRYFEGRAAAPIEVYEAVREIRHGKGMLLVEGEADCRSAGSFFKNPVVSVTAFEGIVAAVEGAVPHWDVGKGGVKLAAAWLVEQAGFKKGYALGRAGISSRHTLALINKGGATAQEIVALRDEVRTGVEARFGVRLEQEPVGVG